ncbi:MAG: hypothetical protein AAF728_00100 [Cyanobacteria bacterium P01_D01_bin.128]
MKTSYKILHSKDAIIVNAEGLLDLVASKDLLKNLISSSEYSESYEILMDLRDANCELGTVDIYELACEMTMQTNPLLPTQRKVAVLVRADEAAFEPAEFLSLCAGNRGLAMQAFTDADAATAWLDADLSDEI